MGIFAVLKRQGIKLDDLLLVSAYYLISHIRSRDQCSNNRAVIQKTSRWSVQYSIAFDEICFNIYGEPFDTGYFKCSC